MLETVNVSLQYGGRVLFEHADLKFTNGNCYGLIGANGAGKSTFMKILAGRLNPIKGKFAKHRTSVCPFCGRITLRLMLTMSFALS